MSYFAVGLAALVVSTLTLFSGFGLGTMLMPVFALFFPVPVAVASTAIVHAANSLFKTVLLLKDVDRSVVLRFGLPAIVCAVGGAWLLTLLAGQTAWLTWRFLGREARVTPVKVVMGVLIVLFALLELVPALRSLKPSPKWLPVGGALSGFFGGLSGHQGALRAAFLSSLELTPAQYAATQAVLAMLVDASRIAVYGAGFFTVRETGGGVPWALVATGIVCAFLGAVLGKRLLEKVTIDAVRLLVGVLLLVIGVALAVGLA